MKTSRLQTYRKIASLSHRLSELMKDGDSPQSTPLYSIDPRDGYGAMYIADFIRLFNSDEIQLRSRNSLGYPLELIGEIPCEGIPNLKIICLCSMDEVKKHLIPQYFDSFEDLYNTLNREAEQDGNDLPVRQV